MKRWRYWRRRWFAYWDKRAAEHNIFDMRFRESNGEVLPMREWRDANKWLSEATEEHDVSRRKRA